jgi:outer membrane lipoprotein-sorting protein
MRTLIFSLLAMLLASGAVGQAEAAKAKKKAAPPEDEAPAEKIAPATILKRADDVRNPADSYLLKVQVTSSDRPDDPSEFEVSLQGNTKTLIKTVKPAKDRGRNMLMLGEEMWAYLPNLKRSVRVGLNQKLVGQAANGDISRMRWSGDYDAQIESETEKEWTLLLTANKKGLTYDSVRAWIEKKTFRPVKAEYLSLSGKVLKKAKWGDYRELCGMVRPGEILIKDAVRPDDQSTIKALAMEVKEFDSSIFSPDGMAE